MWWLSIYLLFHVNNVSTRLHKYRLWKDFKNDKFMRFQATPTENHHRNQLIRNMNWMFFFEFYPPIRDKIQRNQHFFRVFLSLVSMRYRQQSIMLVWYMFPGLAEIKTRPICDLLHFNICEWTRSGVEWHKQTIKKKHCDTANINSAHFDTDCGCDW